jgi:hypothetical protein
MQQQRPHLALLLRMWRCSHDEACQAEVAVAVEVDALDGGRLTHQPTPRVAARHRQVDVLPASTKMHEDDAVHEQWVGYLQAGTNDASWNRSCWPYTVGCAACRCMAM